MTNARTAMTRIPVLLLALAAGCATTRPSAPSGATPAPADPYFVVLGTAQDGGLPQIACRRECCEAARRDPERARWVTSLMLVDPSTDARWLFDASPHLPLQVDRAAELAPLSVPPANGGRPALFDGVFLTHAHTGHYAGLLQFGREVYGSAPVDLIGTPRMMEFLETNGPWSLLFEAGHARRVDLTPEEPLRLAEGISVTPLLVPHRDEFSDTVGFVIRARGLDLLYLPDIDKWSRWERDLADVLEGVDLALLDGTFFGPDELPGRAMSEVPHPFIVETLELLEEAPAELRAKVIFTHLNHSNPAADPESPEARRVALSGARVASEGEILFRPSAQEAGQGGKP
ncbi:MAG: MBL fold metallo-hydrolase [Planctomycetota bacterium]